MCPVQQSLVYMNRTGQISNVTFHSTFQGLSKVEQVPYSESQSADEYYGECKTCGRDGYSCECPSPSIACKTCYDQAFEDFDPYKD